ncbi:MAG: lactonase family protein [Proteobacteria bacterium]|nr:lactonase family protein [Pseudomonadota bacterium]
MRKLVLAFCGVVLWGGCATDLVGEKADLTRVENPAGMTLHPNGRIAYVVGSNFDLDYRATDGGALYVVDLETDTVLPSSKRMGSFGTNVVLSEDARRGYTLTRDDGSLVWFEISEDGRDIRCPLAGSGAEHLLDCRVNLDHNPTHVAITRSFRETETVLPDGTRQTKRVDFDLLMVAHLRESAVTAVTVRQMEDGRYHFSHAMASLVYSAGEVLWHSGESFFVTGRAANNLAVVYPALTEEGEVRGLYVKQRLNVPQAFSAFEGRGMALDPARRKLFMLNLFPNSIFQFDVGGLLGAEASSEPVQARGVTTLPGRMLKVAWVGDAHGLLYLTGFGDDALYLIMPDSLEIVGKIATGRGPYELHADAVRQRLFVLNFLGGDIWAYDTADPLNPVMVKTYLTVDSREATEN